jgi:hypothetical protein
MNYDSQGQYYFIMYVVLILAAAGISIDDYLKERKQSREAVEVQPQWCERGSNDDI